MNRQQGPVRFARNLGSFDKIRQFLPEARDHNGKRDRARRRIRAEIAAAEQLADRKSSDGTKTGNPQSFDIKNTQVLLA